MRWILLILLSNTLQILLGQIGYTKCIIIDDDGFGASEALIVEKSNDFGKPINFIISKGFEEDVKENIDANEYLIIPGITNDTLRVYDDTFKMSLSYKFHESNLKFNRDSSKMILTNKNRAGGKRRGEFFSNNFSYLNIIIIVPNSFDINSFKTNPKDVTVTKNMNYIIFSDTSLNNLTYELKYSKRSTTLIENTINKVVAEINVERKEYLMTIWDKGVEDGDIINIYINGKLAIAEYMATNEKVKMPLPFNETRTNEIIMTFECVNEGKIKPNTIVLNISGHGLNKSVDIAASKKKNIIVKFLLKD